MSADYKPKKVPKDAEIGALISGIVSTNILFSSYAADEQQAIVDAFDKEEIEGDKFVIRQGEPGEKFYIIERGSVDIYVKGSSGEAQKVGNPLSAGASFGELALMYNTPRAASIKSSTNVKLWSIDRTTYRQIVVYYKHMRNKEYVEFLRNVEIKGSKLGTLMNDDELEKMTATLERETFEKGDAIVRQGNTGDHFYIIAQGDVGVFKSTDGGPEEKLAQLHTGGYFGEKAL